MNALNICGLPLNTKIRVKCKNCESEFEGKISEFYGTKKKACVIEMKYGSNMDWWCDGLEERHVMDVIPNIKSIRNNEVAIEELQGVLDDLLIDTDNNPDLVIFPDDDYKPILLHVECPVCGSTVWKKIDDYEHINITSPYDEGNEPDWVCLYKYFGEYKQDVFVVPENKRVVESLLKSRFTCSKNDKKILKEYGFKIKHNG